MLLRRIDNEVQTLIELPKFIYGGLVLTDWECQQQAYGERRLSW
jgi:hypothetical protein